MSKTKDYTKIKERYYSLVEDEVDFMVITALNWYKTLNLKSLSTIIDKPESTTLRYIRKLKDEGLIVFDSETSEDSWGKFYKLSLAAKTVYEEYMHAIDERIDDITENLRDIDRFSEEELQRFVAKEILSDEKLKELPITKNYFYFVSNLQKVITNETMNSVKELSKVLEEGDREKIVDNIRISPIDISTYVNSIKISKWKHLFKINDLIFKFLKDIKKLEDEIKSEMDKENIPEEQRNTQFVNLFTGSLDFEFELEE